MDAERPIHPATQMTTLLAVLLMLEGMWGGPEPVTYDQLLPYLDAWIVDDGESLWLCRSKFDPPTIRDARLEELAYALLMQYAGEHGVSELLGVGRPALRLRHVRKIIEAYLAEAYQRAA